MIQIKDIENKIKKLFLILNVKNLDNV